MVKWFAKWNSFLDAFENRPWIPLAGYLSCYGLLWLVMGVMIANFLHSRWRVLPELSDGNKVTISHICDVLIVTLLFVGVVSSVAIPSILLIGRRFKAALHVLSLSLAGILFSIGVTILLSPVIFVLGLETEKAAMSEYGKNVCADWHNTFTYRSSLKPVGVAGKEQRRYGYVLVDRIGEEGLSYDLYDGEENALLCPNVVCWQQVSNRLCLVTKDGESHSLDFEKGMVTACSVEECKTNVAFASVFALLKERLSKPLRIEQDQVEFFDAYEGLKGWPNLPQIVPEAAKDIMAHCAPVFQGEVASVRCRLTNEHFRKFAKSRRYEFKDYDLCFSQGRSVGRRNDDPIFAHFPPGWYGNVIGHHADGFSICEAIRPGSSKSANESLVYVYDSKCEMLWIEYSR